MLEHLSSWGLRTHRSRLEKRSHGSYPNWRKQMKMRRVTQNRLNMVELLSRCQGVKPECQKSVDGSLWDVWCWLAGQKKISYIGSSWGFTAWHILNLIKPLFRCLVPAAPLGRRTAIAPVPPTLSWHSVPARSIGDLGLPLCLPSPRASEGNAGYGTHVWRYLTLTGSVTVSVYIHTYDMHQHQ